MTLDLNKTGTSSDIFFGMQNSTFLSKIWHFTLYSLVL
jgi:hypothetical protein